MYITQYHLAIYQAIQDELNYLDGRILSIYYARGFSTALLCRIENKQLILDYQYENLELVELIDLVDKFRCTKLINYHSKFNQLFARCKVIDLESAESEQRSRELLDIWEVIKPNVIKSEDNINIENEAQEKCIKQIINNHWRELI